MRIERCDGCGTDREYLTYAFSTDTWREIHAVQRNETSSKPPKIFCGTCMVKWTHVLEHLQDGAPLPQNAPLTNDMDDETALRLGQIAMQAADDNSQLMRGIALRTLLEHHGYEIRKIL